MVLLEGGFHPVLVSHAKELEQMLSFTGGLQQRLQARGRDSGEKYDCLLRVRQVCADLLLKMYAEDSEIVLLDDLDCHWVRLIVSYVQRELQEDRQKAG